MDYKIIVPKGALRTTGNPKHRSWTKDFLAFLPEDMRQEYNCSCCREWYRRYGGDVVVVREKDGTKSIRSAYFTPEQCPDPVFAEAFANICGIVEATKFTEPRVVTEEITVGTNVIFGKPQTGKYTHFHSVVDQSALFTHEEYTILNVIKGHMPQYVKLVTGDGPARVERFLAAMAYAKVSSEQRTKAEKAIKTLISFVTEARRTSVLEAAMNVADRKEIYEICHFPGSSAGTCFLDYAAGSITIELGLERWASFTDPEFYKRAQREAEEGELLEFKKLLERYPGALEYAATQVDQMPLVHAFEVKADEAVAERERSANAWLDSIGKKDEAAAQKPVVLGDVREMSVADFVETIVPKARFVDVQLVGPDNYLYTPVMQFFDYDPEHKGDPDNRALLSDQARSSHVTQRPVALVKYTKETQWLPIYGIAEDPNNYRKGPGDLLYAFVFAGKSGLKTAPPLFVVNYVSDFYKHRRSLETAMGEIVVECGEAPACGLPVGGQGLVLRVTDYNNIQITYQLTRSESHSIVRAAQSLIADVAEESGPDEDLESAHEAKPRANDFQAV